MDCKIQIPISMYIYFQEKLYLPKIYNLLVVSTASSNPLQYSRLLNKMEERWIKYNT